MFSFLKSEKAFSLIELLTVIGILAVLTAVAIPMYGNYKLSAGQAVQKAELAEAAKALEYAHSVDGGYHQKIWTAGYRPNKQALVNVGLRYKQTAKIDCADFPQTAPTTDEEKAQYSKYLTLTKDIYDATKVDSATTTQHICDAGKCVLTMKAPSGFNVDDRDGRNHNTNSGSDTDCGTAFANTNAAGCDAFVVRAKLKISKTGNAYRAYINHQGLICAADGGKNKPLRKL